MSTPIRDFFFARWDRFLLRFQVPVSQTRLFKLEPQKPARAIPLFGSDSGFGEDWNYRTSPKAQGPGVQPLEKEFKDADASANLERWVPDLSRPSLTSHGRRLNYDEPTDQRPIVSFQGEVSDRWDGQVRNTVKKPDFQAVRKAREPTEADKHAEDIRKNGYDFY